jgi:hypothetical protein
LLLQRVRLLSCGRRNPKEAQGYAADARHKRPLPISMRDDRHLAGSLLDPGISLRQKNCDQ